MAESQNQESAGNEASLTSKVGMGGLHGGRGYDTQERYTVCRLPEWEHRPGFSGIYPELSGDVDVLFENLPEGKKHGEHVQVKDFTITPSKLREIVEGFVAWDKGRPDFYRKYIVACPSLNDDVMNLKHILERLGNAPKPQNELYPVEWADLGERLRKMGLEAHCDFIFSKMGFDVDPGAVGDDETCCRHFVGTFLKQEKYQNHIEALARAVYERLLREVQLCRGKKLDLADIVALIEGALAAPSVNDPFANLIIHSWQREEHDLPVQESTVLDWSDDFDRDERRVPSQSDWNSRLLLELRAFKKEIQERTPPPKLIRFRGRSPLSVGFALGATFPQVGGWKIELPQGLELWRTDARQLPGYALRTRALDASEGFVATPDSDALLVVMAVTQPNTPNVARHLKESPLDFAAALEVQPFTGASSSSISGARDASSFALAMRDELKKQNISHGTDRVHLFYNGPLALGVMLGHWLSSVGEVRLYEWQQPGFASSFTLKT